MRFIHISLCVVLLAVTLFSSANNFSNELREQIDRAQREPLLVIKEIERESEQGFSLKTSFNDAEIYYLLSLSYYNLLMPEKALLYALRAYETTDEHEDAWFFHHIAADLSLAYELSGQASLARPFAEKTVAWAKQQNDIALLQKGLIAKGLNELTLGEYDIALRSFTDAYEIAKNHKHSKAPGDIAYYIALVYEYTGENERSITYFTQASDYYRSVSDKMNYSDALYGLAKAYKNVGESQRALELFRQSIDLSIEMNDQQGQAYTLKELAGIYLSEGEIENAHFSLVKSLQFFSNSNNPFMLAEVYKQLAEIAKERESIYHAIALTELALPHTNSDSLRPHFIALMILKADLLAKIRKFKEAYETNRLAFIEQQKYDKKRNSETYERLSAELELNRKNNENEQLTKQNKMVSNELAINKQQSAVLILLLILLMITTLVAIFLYWQSKKVQRKLNALANSDPLTQLSNRRAAFDTLKIQMKLAKREMFELSIALVDLDHFKKINDNYGHPIGDKVLVTFAEVARSTFRASDNIARIGGEEFLFIFPYTSKASAQEIIINFSDMLRENEKIAEIIDEPLTCSVGISDATKFSTEIEALSAADQAMYRAKNAGRDAIVIDPN